MDECLRCAFFGEFFYRVEFVQYFHDNGVNASTDNASDGICHKVHGVATAALHKTLMEFIGATIGKRKSNDNKYAQPLAFGPFVAGPPHGKTTAKGCIFASVSEFVPYMREILEVIARHGRKLKDDSHAKDSGNCTEKRVFVKERFEHGKWLAISGW